VYKAFPSASLSVVLVSSFHSLGLLVTQFETNIVFDPNEKSKLNNFADLTLVDIANFSFANSRFFLSFT
jgi:hypothetical protein